MTMTIKNWKEIPKGFDAVKITQETDDNSKDAKFCIREGTGMDAQTVVFDVFRHNPTGNFYPVQGSTKAFASDVSYVVLAMPVKVLHAATNTGWGLYETARNVKEAMTKRELAPLNPAGNRFWHAGKDIALLTVGLGVGYLLHTYSPTVLGYSIAAVVAVGAATVFVGNNPVKMRVHFGDFENRFGVKSLSDGEVRQMSTTEKVKRFCDGSYTLSRALGLNRIGHKDDKIENENKFDVLPEEVKKKTE
ncbi:MAG: hypothetical protein K1000chlam2_01379 [Chlamydiae bacterium]|nr:hypothetical protein [Chlamydiota bacterium]